MLRRSRSPSACALVGQVKPIVRPVLLRADDVELLVNAACNAARLAVAPVRSFIRWLNAPWTSAVRYFGGDDDDDGGTAVRVERGEGGYERTEAVAPSGVASSGDAPPGLASGADTLRVYHEKVVYTPYKRGVVHGPYLDHVVATVRNSCCSGSDGVADEAVVRAQLLRLMRSHGMREKHIAAKIGELVLAVMYVTDDDRRLARERAWQKWWGRLRKTTNNK